MHTFDTLSLLPLTNSPQHRKSLRTRRYTVGVALTPVTDITEDNSKNDVSVDPTMRTGNTFLFVTAQAPSSNLQDRGLNCAVTW
jgi:hypothetical protein